MGRFGGNKKSQRVNKRPLYTRIKGRQNARRRPLLPGKGVTQASYEAGFFDFLKVFWNHNRGMELRSLTKQVANAWEALLPKPRLSKRGVMKEYSKEFKALQKEIEMQKLEEERMKEADKSGDETGSGTEASSRSNFDDSEASIRSTEATSDDVSGSEGDETLSQTDDDSHSETMSRSQGDSESEIDSDESRERSVRRGKRKRSGRRYESYEAYLKAHGKKLKADTNEENNEENKENKAEQNKEEGGNASSDQNREGNSNDKNPKDGVFFPVREMTSFDRIVRAEFDNQNEMLRKLKLHGSNTDPDVPDHDDTSGVQSVDSFSSPLAGPKFLPKSSSNSITAKLSNPTDTLHVKNLVVGIRQPELQEIFRVFLNDIVLIRVLDNKYNGEAVVEFKTVEAAEKVWRQMNGVEYKRLPLVLEFANKKDLIY